MSKPGKVKNIPKVNINTASEGTFWDRPWTSSPNVKTNGFDGYETRLGDRMPAQKQPGDQLARSRSFAPAGTQFAVKYCLNSPPASPAGA